MRVALAADPDKPPQWVFEGRVWFRPALVRCPAASPASGIGFLNLLGWTLGGLVCLEYDASPCGPYLEVVDMGSLVLSSSGTAGQWGSRLCVSSRTAEELCKATWAVPAEERSIAFLDAPAKGEEDAVRLTLQGTGTEAGVQVTGWKALRQGASGPSISFGSIGRLPLWWTPEIKALWLPFRLGSSGGEGGLKLHDLGLSAKSLALSWLWPGDDPPTSSGAEGFPLPISILADGVKIEIWPSKGTL